MCQMKCKEVHIHCEGFALRVVLIDTSWCSCSTWSLFDQVYKGAVCEAIDLNGILHLLLGFMSNVVNNCQVFTWGWRLSFAASRAKTGAYGRLFITLCIRLARSSFGCRLDVDQDTLWYYIYWVRIPFTCMIYVMCCYGLCGRYMPAGVCRATPSKTENRDEAEHEENIYNITSCKTSHRSQCNIAVWGYVTV